MCFGKSAGRAQNDLEPPRHARALLDAGDRKTRISFPPVSLDWPIRTSGAEKYCQSQQSIARLCRKTPSSAREQFFRLAKPVPSEADGTEAGDVGFVVDAAKREKGRSKPDRVFPQSLAP